MRFEKLKLVVLLLLSTALILSACSEAAQSPAAAQPSGNTGKKAEEPAKQSAPAEDKKEEVKAPEDTKETAKEETAAPAEPVKEPAPAADPKDSASEKSEAPQPSAPAENAPSEPKEGDAKNNDTAPAEDPKSGKDKKEGSEKPDNYSGFFTDSLFIGDSRSVGLVNYGNIGDPTAFCHTGLSVYNYDNDDLDVAGFGKISLEDLLELGSFDKVYIGLGINELGYAEDTTVEKFVELLDMVKANQPSAKIYMLANLHVTYARSKKDKIHNNGKIDSLNSRIEALCDGTKVIYLDANPVFDDGEGNLSEDYTGDNTHLYARCYPAWSQFIYDNSL